MTLYSYRGAFPYPLPQKHFYNGSWTLTSSLSAEELAADGFIEVIAAPELDPTTGDKLDWDGEFWVVIPPNSADIAFKWADVRAQRNKLLADSDFYVVVAYEQNIPVSDSIKQYRQALRDITTNSNPYNITWPILGA